MNAAPVELGDGAGGAEVDAVGVEQRQRGAGEGIGAASPDQRHAAPGAARRQRLVRALAAGNGAVR